MPYHAEFPTKHGQSNWHPYQNVLKHQLIIIPHCLKFLQTLSNAELELKTYKQKYEEESRAHHDTVARFKDDKKRVMSNEDANRTVVKGINDATAFISHKEHCWSIKVFDILTAIWFWSHCPEKSSVGFLGNYEHFYQFVWYSMIVVGQFCVASDVVSIWPWSLFTCLYCCNDIWQKCRAS